MKNDLTNRKIEGAVAFLKMAEKSPKLVIFRDLTPIFSEMLHHKALNRYFSERHYKNLSNIKVWTTSRQNWA